MCIELFEEGLGRRIKVKKAAKVASGRGGGSVRDLKDKIVKEIKVGRKGRVEEKLTAGKKKTVLAIK